MADRLGELVPLPGTDIDWVISGPKGIIIIEHKYPLGSREWQPLTEHQRVIYQDLAMSPRVLAVFVVRYNPHDLLPDLWVAQLHDSTRRAEDLEFKLATWERFEQYLKMKTGLR